MGNIVLYCSYIFQYDYDWWVPTTIISLISLISLRVVEIYNKYDEIFFWILLLDFGKIMKVFIDFVKIHTMKINQRCLKKKGKKSSTIRIGQWGTCIAMQEL